MSTNKYEHICELVARSIIDKWNLSYEQVHEQIFNPDANFFVKLKIYEELALLDSGVLGSIIRSGKAVDALGTSMFEVHSGKMQYPVGDGGELLVWLAYVVVVARMRDMLYKPPT
jgi:hypothetical protein